MNFSLGTMLEMLPDEMLLEICRYLHCGHILFSFYGLNYRLNKTITNYYRQVSLRRLTYEQFQCIYSHILPRIGNDIISLTVNKLQQAYFSLTFGHCMNEIFPNLKTFAFDDWKHEEFFAFVSNRLRKLEHLRTIIVRGLRRTIKNPISKLDTINDHPFMTQMLLAIPQLTRICFEPDCYSFRLFSNNENEIIQSNIIELNISIDVLDSLVSLPTLFPNIRRLNAVIENVSTIKSTVPSYFRFLTDFSLNAIDCRSSSKYIVTILQLMPNVERLSLTLTTCDSNLANGQYIFTLLPAQFSNNNFIGSFKYVVHFYAYADYKFDVTTLVKSWKPFPIVYVINKEEYRTHILIHTIPYTSTLLSLRSQFADKFGTNKSDEVYKDVQYVYVSHATTLAETFTILRHCRRMKDLTIQMDEKNKISTTVIDKQQTLPRLGRLELLSVFGALTDWNHLKILILAAHNLSTLCIDLESILLLFTNNNDEVILPRVIHLFVDGESNESKLSDEQIHHLCKMFPGLRSLKIKYNTCDMIDLNIVGSLLDNFKQLIVFTINGKMPDETSNENIRKLIIEHSNRLSSTERAFKVECIDDWFQVWL